MNYLCDFFTISQSVKRAVVEMYSFGFPVKGGSDEK